MHANAFSVPLYVIAAEHGSTVARGAFDIRAGPLKTTCPSFKHHGHAPLRVQGLDDPQGVIPSGQGSAFDANGR